MKPRTKLQCEVVDLSNRYLHTLSENQKEYASENFLNHIAYATKNKAHCMDCGHEIQKELISRKRVECTGCKRKLKIKETRNRIYKQLTYFAFAEIVKDFQVIRYFKLTSTHRIRWRKECEIEEVLQHWIGEDGKREVIAKRHLQSYYSWSDTWGGKLEIRNKKDERKYDVVHSNVLPDSEFKSIYSKYGIDKNTNGCSFLETFRLIQHNSKMETLLKAKQYSMFRHSFNNSGDIYRNWDSIKICIRNKKNIKDANIFFDYLELLRFFNKDVRNAKYLFPKSIKLEHDKLVKKKRAIEEKKSIEEKKRKAELHEKEYTQRITNFMGLFFKEKDLVVKVMESVHDFVKEGDLLHHCIYTNEYFKKENSLILSARKKDAILETIEVDLTKMQVVQARGKYNQNSEYHEDFLNLVQQNMNKIAERVNLVAELKFTK